MIHRKQCRQTESKRLQVLKLDDYVRGLVDSDAALDLLSDIRGRFAFGRFKILIFHKVDGSISNGLEAVLTAAAHHLRHNLTTRSN